MNRKKVEWKNFLSPHNWPWCSLCWVAHAVLVASWAVPIPLPCRRWSDSAGSPPWRSHWRQSAVKQWRLHAVPPPCGCQQRTHCSSTCDRNRHHSHPLCHHLQNDHHNDHQHHHLHYFCYKHQQYDHLPGSDPSHFLTALLWVVGVGDIRLGNISLGGNSQIYMYCYQKNCPRKYSSTVLHMLSSVQYWPEPGTLLARKGAEEGGMLTMMMIAICPARYLRQPPCLLIIIIITGQHCHHHGHNLSSTNLSQILLLAPLGLAC